MNSPSWFRLAVRLLGVLFIGLAAPSIVSAVGSLLSTLQYFTAPGNRVDMLMAITGSSLGLLGVAMQGGLGLYLLLGGEGLIRHILRDARDRCPTCQYSTRGLTTATCPECGGMIETGRATRGAA